MKKLAVVVDTFPRWSERFIARELQELLRRGLDLTVFCLKAGAALPDDEDWRGLEERRVALRASLLPTPAKNLAPGVGERWRQARAALGLSAYRQLGRAATLRKYLLDGGFQHVHAHFANLPSTIAWLACAATKQPFSFSVHARDLFLEAQLLDAKLTDCARVFACHRRAEDHLAAKTAHKGKVRLMHHGLPLEQFAYAPRSSRGVARILAAGRFVPKKGFGDLLEAASLPVLAKRQAAVTLLGEGPEGKALAAKIAKLRLGAKVAIQEPVGGAAMRQILAAADLFVAPYCTAPDGDADGVPNVILEAFALGLPVIGTDAGGLGEILTPETGTVVAQNDPAALARAIAGHLDDPESARQKARAARALVERDYDIRRNIEPLWELVAP